MGDPLKIMVFLRKSLGYLPYVSTLESFTLTNHDIFSDYDDLGFSGVPVFGCPCQSPNWGILSYHFTEHFFLSCCFTPRTSKMHEFVFLIDRKHFFQSF